MPLAQVCQTSCKVTHLNTIIIKVNLTSELLWKNHFSNFNFIFPKIKITLNSIGFAPLVWKLQNDKHAHQLIKGSPTIRQVKGESPWFGRVLAFSHPNQTLILILSISAKSRLTRGRGFIWNPFCQPYLQTTSSLNNFWWVQQTQETIIRLIVNSWKLRMSIEHLEVKYVD